MKNLILLTFFCLLQVSLRAQTYPFQDNKLSDEKRLDNLISQLTLDEKINCLSTRLSIPRLGIKGTRTVEGLHGLALSGPANWAVKGKGESCTTTFPQSIGLAETWDPELLTQLASLEAEECRYLAQSPKYGSAGLIVFSPNADLGRDVRWGRTEECYGEDAYLTSRLVVAFVKGLQGNDPKYWKTASLMKHFLANSNENNRTINSSDFDERLFREYYSYPFFKGVTEGGSRAFMTAYNKYNGIPCVVHPVLRDVTINEWGQNGIIATDGGAYRQLLTTHKYYPDLQTAAAECIKAGNRTINSSDFDERLFREYYSYPFFKGVTEGGSRAFMTAYNKYNGIPCVVNPVLRDVTINEWGQNGIIATDGGAYRQLLTTHKYYPDLQTAAAECIKAGITMFLDNYKEPLKQAITAGKVSEKEIDNAIRGTLRVMLKLGLFDQSTENPYSQIGITDTIAPWTKHETLALVRKATVESIVLLKNNNQLLPINMQKVKNIAVIGPSSNKVISDWYAGTPPYAITALEGIRNAVGSAVEISYTSSNKADSAVIAAKKADIAIVC